MKGRWVIGPGKNLFRVLNRELPDIRIIAEDLGCVNRRVKDLLSWCGYPGMKVLTFGFDSDETNPHYPGNYGQKHWHLPKNSLVSPGLRTRRTPLSGNFSPVPAIRPSSRCRICCTLVPKPA